MLPGECGAIKSKDETFYEFTSQLLMYFSRDGDDVQFFSSAHQHALGARTHQTADFSVKYFLWMLRKVARGNRRRCVQLFFVPRAAPCCMSALPEILMCVFASATHHFINIKKFLLIRLRHSLQVQLLIKFEVDHFNAQKNWRLRTLAPASMSSGRTPAAVCNLLISKEMFLFNKWLRVYCFNLCVWLRTSWFWSVIFREMQLGLHNCQKQ